MQALEGASLRGLGGAGFPTGRKWRSVRGEPGPRLMAVNGDEGEPGTFKDRYYLETDPHRFLEGMLIGAHVVEARRRSISICATNIRPRARSFCARSPNCRRAVPCVHLRRGAGAYICGEESSMLESLEGKRGLPRHRPPFPFQVGLFGRADARSTMSRRLFWVRDIVEKGADWWTQPGPQRAARLAQLFGVGPRQKSRA